MALSKIQPASIDLTDNYAFTGTNSIAGIDYEETKLATQTASSSDTLQFTSSITSTYKIYKFRFVDLHPATDGSIFRFQANAAGGSGFNETITSTDFESFHNEGDDTTGLSYQANQDQAQGTSFQTLTNSCGADADQCISGELFLFDPSSTTFVKHFICRTQSANDGNYSFDVFVSGYFNTTTAIDEVQFKMSSGNIDSGTIEMYGIN
tara:strand:+ start:189 stop:812 length:624 start_codon:yes stop_codon:yes gene_type:complete